MLARVAASRAARAGCAGRLFSRPSSTTPLGSPGLQAGEDPAIARAAKLEAEAEQAVEASNLKALEARKAVAAAEKVKDYRYYYSGCFIATVALVYAVRLNQRARIHENERAELRREMYADIEQSEQRRARLLQALPGLAQTAAGLKAADIAKFVEDVDREST